MARCCRHIEAARRKLDAGEWEREAGVTLHQMVARADAGDIVGQRAVAIDDADNALTLYRKLVPLGVELVNECIRESSPGIRRGERWISQKEVTSDAENPRTDG